MTDEQINRLINKYISQGIFSKIDVIKTLTKLKKQTDAIISVIVLACDNEYDGIKINAIEAIDELKIKSPEIMLALTKLCEHKNDHISKYAREVKKKLGETLEDPIDEYLEQISKSIFSDFSERALCHINEQKCKKNA